MSRHGGFALGSSHPGGIVGQSPRRIAPRIAGVIKAKNIAIGIVQVSFAPKPNLILRRLVEFYSQSFEPLVGGVHVIALKIDYRMRGYQRLECMQRKCGAVSALESCIARQRADDLSET